MAGLKAFVDPAVRRSALAIFRSDPQPDMSGRPRPGTLVWAGLLDEPQDRLGLPTFDAVPSRLLRRIDGGLVEIPRVRRSQRQKGDQNDLIDLTFMAGQVGPAMGVYLKPVWPETWKGQVPKDVMVRRIVDRLTDGEARQVVWPSRGDPTSGLNHNVADAIGIGLWHYRRLG